MVQASSRHIAAIRPRLKFWSIFLLMRARRRPNPSPKHPYFALTSDSCTRQGGGVLKIMFVLQDRGGVLKMIFA